MGYLNVNLYEYLPTYLQNTILSMYGNRIKRERFCREYYEWQEFLNRSQYFSEEELEEYQNEKLRKLVAHIYEYVPYYRGTFDRYKIKPKDIRKKEDLQKLPVLRKEEVRKNLGGLIATKHRRSQLKLGHTSGTTGSPLEILWDKNVDVLHNVAIWRHRNWAGFKFGNRYASLLGRVIVPINQKAPPFYRINKPWNQYLFSSFHLTDANLKYYFDAFAINDIRFLEAYPSTAFILAKYLEQHDLFYEMRAIVTSSETLLAVQREVIEERFRCKIFDYYGMAERVMFSGECEKHEGHHLHVEYGITEILDDNNEVVPEGKYGKLVLTGLHNYGMPLIRYEIGDVSAIKKEKCTCGRKLPLLECVTTKAEDIVVTSEGRLISSSVLTHPFKPMHNVLRSQIVQEDYDRLLVKIVKKASYSNRDTEMLLKSMKERVGEQMNISVEFVSDIPLSSNGKYRWVISKVPLKFGLKSTDNLFDR